MVSNNKEMIVGIEVGNDKGGIVSVNKWGEMIIVFCLVEIVIKV